MANVRIGYDFPGRDSGTTLTVSSVNSDYPGSNLQDERVGKPWRGAATELTSIEVKWDFGAAKSIQAISLFNHNLTAAATVKFQMHTADSWGTPDVDESIEGNLVSVTPPGGSASVVPRLTYYLSAASSKQWARLVITDAANPDTYIQIGCADPFAFYEPTRNITDEVRVEIVDPSTVTGTNGGARRTKLRDRFRRLSFDFAQMDRTQRDEWDAIVDTVGEGAPIVFGMDPTSNPTTDTLYGYLDRVGSLNHVFNDDWRVGGVVFSEMVR